MELTRDSYRKMNKAYNTIFDEWQSVKDMPPKLYQTMNMAMVLLDNVLDELKKSAVEVEPSVVSESKKPSTAGFTVLGGK